MWWKIYFWVVLVLSLVGYPILYGDGKILSLFDWVDIVIGVTWLLGLYSFIYKKTFFTQKVWKYIFWGGVVYIVFWVFYYFTLLREIIPLSPAIISRSYDSGQTVLWDIVLSLPIYYALYQLGYKKASKKK